MIWNHVFLTVYSQWFIVPYPHLTINSFVLSTHSSALSTTNGRYAYGRQPQIAQWNLARFAETLLPPIHDDSQSAVSIAKEAISRFSDTFHHYWLAGMRAKLGLLDEQVDDGDLAEELLACMHRHGADFTTTYTVPLITTWYAGLNKGAEATPSGWRPGKATLKPGPDLVGKVWEVWKTKMAFD